jgi:hypothetical protein
MGDHVGAMRSTVEDQALDPLRAPGRTEAPSAIGMPGRGAAPGALPVAALLGLHRAAGNAAVIQMLRAGGMPAAPAPPAPAPADRDEEAGAPIVAEPSPRDLLGTAVALEEGERPTREMRAAKRAESESVTATDEDVQTGGGGFPVADAPPVADAVPMAGRFQDAGRSGFDRFGDAADQGLDHDRDDGRPHAFVPGGKTGTSPWGGGGGAGPHGNQDSGSADLVVPEYESSWGGVFDNADAWVKDGTGIVTVNRSYVTSNSGDQGNGWYVTDKAAAALEKHEQKHVGKSRSMYADHIQPMLDRIVTSYAYGKGKVYKSSEAVALLQRYVGWGGAIKSFDEDDKAWNGKGGAVDQEDQYSPNFPRQIGAGKVSGKDYTNRLKMPGEDAPPE